MRNQSLKKRKQIRKVKNELMQEKYKNAAVEIIERILKNTEHRLITIDEGMKMLCNPLDGIVL